MMQKNGKAPETSAITIQNPDLVNARRGYPLTLPSGIRVRMRGLSPSMFIFGGVDVPDMLTPLVNELMTKGAPKELTEEPTTEDAQNAYLDQARKWSGLMKIIMLNAIAEPRVVETDPADNEIALYEFRLEDMSIVTANCFRAASDLERFCKEFSAAMERVLAGEDLQDTPQSTPEPESGDAAGGHPDGVDAG